MLTAMLTVSCQRRKMSRCHDELSYQDPPPSKRRLVSLRTNANPQGHWYHRAHSGDIFAMKLLLAVIAFLIGTQSFAWGYQSATSWRLSTDDTVMVVALQQGIPAVTQLSSARTGSNWLLAPAPEVLPSSVTQQGTPVVTNWHYDGASQDPESGQLELRFSNAAPALQLQSIWRARPGHGPVEHWLTIANHSDATITVGHQDSLVLDNVEIPKNESMDAWWIKRGGGNATTEGGTYLQSVGRHSSQTLTS